MPCTKLSAMRRYLQKNVGAAFFASRPSQPHSRSSLNHTALIRPTLKNATSTLAPQNSFFTDSFFKKLQNVTWNYKTKEEKKSILFKTLEEKIAQQYSTAFPDLNLEQLLAKIRQEGLMLDQHQNLSIIEIAIAASAKHEQFSQKKLMHTFENYGIPLHDKKILNFALDHHNFGAVSALQPYFEPMELFAIASDFIKKSLTATEKIKHDSVTYYNQLKNIKALKDILKRPVKKKKYSLSKLYKGKKFEITFDASSFDEIGLFHDDIANNFETFNWNVEAAEKNHTSTTENTTDASHNVAQELHDFHVRINRENIDPEDIFGYASPQEGNLKAAFLKLMQKFHPDKFDSNNAELKKMAHEVCLKLNKLYTLVK